MKGEILFDSYCFLPRFTDRRAFSSLKFTLAGIHRRPFERHHPFGMSWFGGAAKTGDAESSDSMSDQTFEARRSNYIAKVVKKDAEKAKATSADSSERSIHLN